VGGEAMPQGRALHLLDEAKFIGASLRQAAERSGGLDEALHGREAAVNRIGQEARLLHHGLTPAPPDPGG
jgi:hypothetical protein